MIDSLCIETERLLLRPTQFVDFEPWVEFMADPESSRFIGGPQPRAAVWRGFMAMAGSWHLQGYSMFSVIEKSSGRWIGRVGPWQPDGWPGTEVGWAVVRDVWGKGYGREAAVASIDWAFDHLKWTEVVHCIDPENRPSQALAHRLGSSNTGIVRLPEPFETISAHLWRQSREHWRDRRRQNLI